MGDPRAELLRGAQFPPPAHLDDHFDILMTERDLLRNSADLVDTAIEAGVATNKRLITQGQVLAHSTGALQQFIGRFPGLEGLKSKVDVRRQRDRWILGGLIGVLAFLLFLYVFG
jgi:hypothetical protein